MRSPSTPPERMRPGRAARRWRLVALLAAVLAPGVLAPDAARGQEIPPLKRLTPPAEFAECEGTTPAPPPPPDVRRAAADLVARADQESLLGNTGAARTLLQRAAQLDPTAPEAAYRLARVHEELRERDAAIREYCRFTTLESRPADREEARQRIQRLRLSSAGPLSDAVLQYFRSGVEAAEAGRLQEAEDAFTAAIGAAPDWAAPRYNRAVVRWRQDEAVLAHEDWSHYLALAPDADDRSVVRRSMSALRALPGVDIPPPPTAPSTALLRGLLLPGAGQLATGRRTLGIAVAGGAAGAVIVALMPREVSRTGDAVDPFGNVYQYSYRVRERPLLWEGLGAAALITVAGAVEAYYHARRQQQGAGPPAVGLTLGPSHVGVHFRLTLPAARP